MKNLLIIIMFFLCGKAFGQYLPASPTAYGSNNNRIKVKIILLTPTICGVPTYMSSYSSDSTSSADIYDSCGHKKYTYDPSNRTWSVSGSGASSGNADSLGHIAASGYALTNLNNILSTANLLITTGTILTASITVIGRIVTGSISTTGNGSFGGLTISGNTAASTITGSTITLTGGVTQGGFTSAISKANSSGQLVSALSGIDYLAPGGTGITTGSASTVIAAGTKIQSIDFYDTALTYISIGTTVNGWQLSPRFTVSSGTYSTIVLNKYFVSSTTIYFNGVTSNTIIKIYKL